MNVTGNLKPSSLAVHSTIKSRRQLVPVQVSLPVIGRMTTEEEAKQAAIDFFASNPTALSQYIIPGSVDESSILTTTLTQWLHGRLGLNDPRRLGAAA